ncbi:MAG: hypothetical protein COB17_07095 [Sulfurimonas sp.]|nr:MAG: hypothetical protein COB17_07095 [Sulfurimonas sp.]
MNFNKTKNFIFPNWKSLHRLNKSIIESINHIAYIDIYANDLAKVAYLKKSTLYPVDSIIVKPLYPKKKRKNISRLVIMIKMHNGYDVKNNNWWYGVYDKTGNKVFHEGRIKSCIKCHEIAKETDYLFSETIIDKISLDSDF